MDEQEKERRRRLAMDAAMEGQQAIVASIGSKVTVSDMELICLVNFAEIGLMSLFCELDGAAGEAAQSSLDAHLDAIRQTFGRDGRDGLERLSQSGRRDASEREVPAVSADAE